MSELIVGSDYSGVGAFDQSLIRLDIPFKKLFACDFDYNARLTYVLNFGTENDLEIAKSKEHKMFCDGMEFIILGKDKELEQFKFDIENSDLNEKELIALKSKIEKLETKLREFEKNCKKLLIDGIDLETKKYNFSITADQYANTFSFYYPFNVYDREIPENPLDIYMTSPPCQAFSLAGKRLGKADIKGILFFNSLEFITKNKPKTFIFENVKGLLSDDKTNKTAQYGNTFQEWINFLGGKSVNGAPTFFPCDDSVPYHIFFKVLNAKEYGVPQNRERIFIVGIRDDENSYFEFPKTFPLEKRLKDILETVVDEKYFLSEKMTEWLTAHSDKNKEKGNGFNFKIKNPGDVGNSINARVFKMGIDDNYVYDEIIQLNDPIHSNDRVYSDEGISPTLNTMQGGNRQPFVQVSDQVIQINPSLESGGKQPYQHNRVYNINGVSPTIDTDSGGRKNILVSKDDFLINRNKYNDYSQSEISSCITAGGTAGGSNLPLVVCFGRSEEEKIRRKEHFKNTGKDSGSFKDKTLVLKNQDYYDTILANPNFQKESLIAVKQRIRRLTPTECFRLMNFNPEMIDKTISSGLISDSQLYKQAGNSICVEPLKLLVEKLYKKIKP